VSRDTNYIIEFEGDTEIFEELVETVESEIETGRGETRQ